MRFKHTSCRQWLVSCAVIGVVTFLVTSDRLLCSVAIGEDIAAEAAASRKQLVDDMGSVESAALRAELLRPALANRAKSPLQHWYSGEVLWDGQWITLDEAEKQAAEDDDLSDYRDLRSQASNTAYYHEKLARWCQKKDLTELANMHWLHVLRFQPKHKIALKMLNLGWHQGMLLTQAELDRYQENQRQRQQEIKQWRSKVKRIRRELEQGEPPQQLAAREELLEIRNPDAVPALLEEFNQEGTTEQVTINRGVELIAALGNIDAPAAVEALVRFAVESTHDPVQYAAVGQLNDKAFEEYVPILLSGMRMPVEASVNIREIRNRIVNSYSYTQEGHAGQQYQKQSYSSYTILGQRYIATPLFKYRRIPRRKTREGYTKPARTIPAFDCNGHLVPEQHIAASYIPPAYSNPYVRKEYTRTAYHKSARFQANRLLAIQQSQTEVAGLSEEMEQVNAKIEQQNAQIVDVLIEVTGETLTLFPKSWWNWWGGYLDQHPELAATGARQQWNLALLNQDPRGLSRGTWVWTRQGLVAVESILPGDFVLSQDPRSGELAYKVVLAIASARELAVSKIELAADALHCSPGHVVWASGYGWRRVGKLVSGELLHGVHDELQIGAIDEAFSIDSYDLIVDDFHTLFVGESGVLVHDPTPVGAAHVALPGFSPAEVANAAHLAAAAQR